MKPFDAPGVFLLAPDDWADYSTYVLVGPPVADGRVTAVVNLSRHVPDADVRAHVDRQMKELAKMQQFALKKRDNGSLGPLPAVMVEFVWKQPGGPLLRQRQWYAWDSGSVWTLTGTAPDVVFDKHVLTFVDMAHSFKPKSW